MTPEAHRAFTAELLRRLAPDPDVLGLVGLGSTSGLPPSPDPFSDHDLFVVTRAGAQERFRADLSWLPGDAGPPALAFRETAHGVKVLLASGHLVEFAAFDLEELSLARVNRYGIFLDRADVAERLARVRKATASEIAARTPPDPAFAAGQVLTHLVVGAGRWARGERLAGHAAVRVAALGHLVSLLRADLAPETQAILDDLDPMRRLERALPEVARDLEDALVRPLPAAARGLLAVLERQRPDLVTAAARRAVERVLERAEG